MRELGACALVFVAGCSLVWDMDPYDTNASDATNANDGGASSSGASGNGGASTSSGATTSTSSGGSSGSSGETLGEGDASTFEAGTLPGGDAGSDAATEPSCTFESEPNNLDSEAEEITTAKKTCGKVSPSDSKDYFYIDVTTNEVIAVEFGPYVRLDVTYGDDSTKGSATPGGYYVTLEPGENTLKFSSTGPSMGAYAIYRQ